MNFLITKIKAYAAKRFLDTSKFKNEIIKRNDCAVVKLDRRDGTRYDCLVDYEDLWLFKKYKWSFNRGKRIPEDGYVIRFDYKNKKMIRLHRVISECPDGLQVDHINHNGLDNRRSNLRIVTHRQNQKNRKPYKHWGKSWLEINEDKAEKGGA